MIRVLLAVLLSLALAPPAQAHRLKVFAATAGDIAQGHAFFIGGGRSKGARWRATDAQGLVLADGQTDAEGRFGPIALGAAAGAVTVTVDTGEGHVASTVLRIAGTGTNPSPTEATADTPTPDLRLIEAAVERQVAPLLERIDQMDARLRFADILSGIFLIIGLAGVVLWARAGRGRP